MNGRPPGGPPSTGATAPALDLPLLDGGRFALSALSGRTVLVTFLRHAG